MRPIGPKCHPSSIQDLFRHWVFQAIAAIVDVLLNRYGDRPSAKRRVLQMLFHGVVIFLPSVKITLAQIASRVVWARGRGFVEETSSRKLGAISIRMSKRTFHNIREEAKEPYVAISDFLHPSHQRPVFL